MHEHAAQATGGDDQWRQDRRPGQGIAEQQADQHAVVAVQASLAVGAVVAAALGGEQPGKGTEQGTADQIGGSQGDGQQAQQAAQRIALQQDLAEAVEQGRGPVGARVDEILGVHGGSLG
ncbi:hypothetical protein D3C75_1110520 [compost metagenome]